MLMLAASFPMDGCIANVLFAIPAQARTDFLVCAEKNDSHDPTTFARRIVCSVNKHHFLRSRLANTEEAVGNSARLSVCICRLNSLFSLRFEYKSRRISDYTALLSAVFIRQLLDCGLKLLICSRQFSISSII